MKCCFLLFFSAIFSSSYLSAYSPEGLEHYFGISTNGIQLQLPGSCFIHTEIKENRQYSRLVVSDGQGQNFGLDLEIHGTQQQRQHSLEIGGQIYVIPEAIPHSSLPTTYTHLANTSTTPRVPDYPHGHNFIGPQHYFYPPVTPPSISQWQATQQQEQLRLSRKNTDLSHQAQELRARNNELSSRVEGYRQQIQSDQDRIAELTKQLSEMSATLKNQEKKMDVLAKQNDGLTKRNNVYQAEQESLRQSNREVTEQAQKLTTQNDELSSRVEGYHQQTQNDQTRITELTKQLSEMSATLKKQNKKMDGLEKKNNAYQAKQKSLQQSNRQLTQQASQAVQTDLFSQPPVDHRHMESQTEATVNNHVATQMEARRMNDQSTQTTPTEPEQSNKDQEKHVPENLNKKKYRKKKKKPPETKIETDTVFQQNEEYKEGNSLPEQPARQKTAEKKTNSDNFKKEINKSKSTIRRNSKKAGETANSTQERSQISEAINSYCNEFLRDHINHDSPESIAFFLQEELEKLMSDIIERNQFTSSQEAPPPSSSSDQIEPRITEADIFRDTSAGDLFSAHITLWIELVSQFPALMHTGSPFFLRLTPVFKPPASRALESLSEEALTAKPDDKGTSILLTLMRENFKKHEAPLRRTLINYNFNFDNNPDAIPAFIWAVLAAHILNDDELIDHLLNLLPDNYTGLLEAYMSNLDTASEQHHWLIYNILFIQRLACTRQRIFLKPHMTHGVPVEPGPVNERNRQTLQLQRLINPILNRATETEGASAIDPLSRLQLISPDTALNQQWQDDCNLVSSFFSSLPENNQPDQPNQPLQNETQYSLLPALLMELRNAATPVNIEYKDSSIVRLAKNLAFNYEVFDHLFDLVSSLGREGNDVFSEEEPAPVSADDFLHELLKAINAPEIQTVLTILNEQGKKPEDITINQMARLLHLFTDSDQEIETKLKQSVYSLLKSFAFYLKKPIVFIFPSPASGTLPYGAYFFSTDPNQSQPDPISDSNHLREYIRSHSPLIVGYERFQAVNRHIWFRFTPQGQATLMPDLQPPLNSTTGSGQDPDPDDAASTSPSNRDLPPIIILQNGL
ncbi:putative nuclease with TOPRIM domain [Endozoicomonas sp. NE35]